MKDINYEELVKEITQKVINKMNEPVEIILKKEDSELPYPKYMTDGAAAMDIYSSSDIVINSGETVLVPTGLSMVIPEGYEIQIRPRSGLSYKTPLSIKNSPGTIDCDYRGEFKVIMTNQSINSSPFEIKKGERIAQIVLNKVSRIKFKTVENEEFEKYSTKRGKSGFGHTGDK